MPEELPMDRMMRIETEYRRCKAEVHRLQLELKEAQQEIERLTPVGGAMPPQGVEAL